MALRWAGRSGRSPRASDTAIDSKPGDQAQRRQSGPVVQTGLMGVQGAGVAPHALSFGAVQRATMARGAEARAAMVAAADLRLAEAGVPNPPRHADISRSDLSQPLHPDPRRAEKGAGGAVAYCAADASPPRATTRRVGRGISSIWSLSASGPPRLRIALCRGIGKETFLPERTTRTSLPLSSAIPASRCSSRSPARTRRLLLLRMQAHQQAA